MADSIRDTSAGQFLRAIGFKLWLAYPEELPGFEPQPMPAAAAEELSASHGNDLEKTLSKIAVRDTTANATTSQSSSEKDITIGEAIVVSWTENDRDNPRNWTQGKKAFTLTLINVYTFVVYLTASIITPTAEFIMQRYDVSIIVASLGLSMYVVGCKSCPPSLLDVLVLTFACQTAWARCSSAR